LDYFDNTIVRREIHVQGRSRAFINDTPVQLNVLKAFSGQLIHIHSQYNTLELKDVDFQLKVLDVLAGSLEERERFHINLSSFQERKKYLTKLKSNLADVISQADYNAFQLNELEELNLNEVNFDKIKDELSQIENADEIRGGYGAIIDAFQNEEGINDKLNSLKSVISKKSSFDKGIQSLSERINAVLIETTDIASEAEEQLESIEVDPSRIDELTSMLDSYNRILQKHNKSNQSELLELYYELSESSFQHGQLENEIESITKELATAENNLLKHANELHKIRSKAIPEIETKLTAELKELKLDNTVLKFELNQQSGFNAFGNSMLEILFSPNIGIDPVPVHKAASGGELSRVMLALQSLMSSKVKLRTMLFDEIDTGVSGDVAQKMGATLKKMGSEMQVIAITHLPQVAAKGGQHLKVVKRVDGDKTKTFVQELTSAERIEETARLMSGDEINAAALDNAKALMQ